jgi:hypothetical protein
MSFALAALEETLRFFGGRLVGGIFILEIRNSNIETRNKPQPNNPKPGKSKTSNPNWV